MEIESERFGNIELDEDSVINFPAGVIGFPNERGFILVKHGDSSTIGWLQSIETPALAFPVVSAHGFDEYPDVSLGEVAEKAGVAGDDMAVLAVLSAKSGTPSTVNLLAPIVVNADTRTAAQIILEGSRYSTRELFILPGIARSNPPAAATGTDGS